MSTTDEFEKGYVSDERQEGLGVRALDIVPSRTIK